MPTDWKYNADGVNTAVSTKHDLDGSLKSMTVELDAFRSREWPEDEDEIRRKGRDPKNMSYDQEDEVFIEFADGAHATFEFDVDTDNAAELKAVTPEDGDALEPRHMMLFPAAERVVEANPVVEWCRSTLETLTNRYEDAQNVEIHKLDD